MKSATLIIRVVTVLLIFSWSLQASAQANPNYDQAMSDKLLYTSKYFKYKNMKTAGLIMTLGGGILGIVGLTKLTNAPYTTNSYGQITYTGNDATTGAAMFLVSIPLVGAGIPLAIVGNVKSKKYGRLMESTTFSGSLMPGRKGVTLSYRF